ncbi:hypothetical protein EDB83DRAFT_2317235 [Lactarius deliciosus]|nr:hypothetical protein EDB83DRAFT_2317235 [Lactarius deliciosus]
MGSGVAAASSCAPLLCELGWRRLGERKGPGATGRGTVRPRGNERWWHHAPHFHANGVARTGGEGGAGGDKRRCALVCPLPRKRGGGGVPSCASFPSGPGATRRGGGRRSLVCHPSAQRGGADRGKGEAGATGRGRAAACPGALLPREQAGAMGDRERAVCPRAFRANEAARTGGEGRGRGRQVALCLCVPPSTRTRWGRRAIVRLLPQRTGGNEERRGRHSLVCHPSARRGSADRGKGEAGATGREKGGSVPWWGPWATGRGRRALVPSARTRRRGQGVKGGARDNEEKGGGPGATGRGAGGPSCAPFPREWEEARTGGEGKGRGEGGEGGARTFALLLHRRDGAGMWKEGKGRGRHNPRGGQCGGRGKGWVGDLPLCAPFLCANGAAVNGGKEKGQVGGQLTFVRPLFVRVNGAARDAGEGHRPALLRPLLDVNGRATRVGGEGRGEERRGEERGGGRRESVLRTLHTQFCTNWVARNRTGGGGRGGNSGLGGESRGLRGGSKMGGAGTIFPN